ncbi:hypothetical protein CDAR_61051 [Caerostris darwini]|uniref:Uncharacterized protein n=1 Tax=Caerostris darwini TaxID=1538125 RepID=A0AAV4RYB4_9ARAC|nr:hypothetical protein CDAR_61051 [Caerostris darwini]
MKGHSSFLFQHVTRAFLTCETGIGIGGREKKHGVVVGEVQGSSEDVVRVKTTEWIENKRKREFDLSFLLFDVRFFVRLEQFFMYGSKFCAIFLSYGCDKVEPVRKG